ncbi:MAG TPA: GNAT family N-acetyltransferase [Pyrinomonadaceae bacterium]|nr:GNAT family N-acetyltransferase [Pyrinomonadaceae bacterium]
MKLRVLKSDFDSDFIEQILRLDKANMQAVLDNAGLEFPEQNRRDGFKKNPTLIVAENKGEVAGYLEYTRSWNDADLIYLSSIQIEEKYRRSDLILKLIDEFVKTVGQENFKGFETNVQKNNFPVINLYRKIGFEFKENPHNRASWRLTADREILNESPVNALLEKWRKKRKKS